MTQAQSMQIFNTRNTPAFKRIFTWLHSPCPIVLLELTLRNQPLLPGLSCVVPLINHAVFNLARQHLHAPSPSSCKINISCFATIHKLLLVSTSTMEQLPNGNASKVATLKQLTATHMKLQYLLSEIQTRPPGAITQYQSAHSMFSASSAPITSAGPTQQAMQQLRAMVAMLLTWLGNCLRRVMLSQEGAAAQSFYGLMDWLLKLATHDPELTEIAAWLALPKDPQQWESSSFEFMHECARWDEYACMHLHSRLLPGCSYLGCTNISGTSEASLPTLLCSGCRRTRYCSAGCQKAAWGAGGHSDVCGRGKWAASRRL